MDLGYGDASEIVVHTFWLASSHSRLYRFYSVWMC